MADARAARRPVPLGFADGEVMVTPRDRDIFFISADKATEACRDALKTAERFARFESEILVPLHDWCVARAGRVRACYIPVPKGHIPVFVVTASGRYDFALGEEVAALEADLARAGWRIGVSQLPDAGPEALDTFFDPEGALEVYAQSGPAPVEGGK